MITRRRTLAHLLLALGLCAPTLLEAQAFGRALIEVVDEQGNPVPGAKITVTCPELPRFHEETKTNKKGRVTVGFTDATKVYVVTVQAEGYPAARAEVKAALRVTTEHQVVLRSTRSAPDESGVRRVYTPGETVFNQGVELVKAGDLEGAKARFSEALEKQPDLIAVHSALAALHLELGDFAAATREAERYLELSPNDPATLYTLYRAHQGLGNEEQARAALEALSKLDQGDSAALLYNEGVAALAAGDAARAKHSFLAALELDADLVPALTGLATVQIDEGSFAEAAATTERLLAVDAGNQRGLELRYQAYRQLGDAEKARAAFQALAALDPQGSSRQAFDRAVQLFNGGDIAGSIEQFELSLEADPGQAKAHYYLGLAYTNSNQQAKAKQHLESFLEMAPEDPDAATAAEMVKYLGS